VNLKKNVLNEVLNVSTRSQHALDKTRNFYAMTPKEDDKCRAVPLPASLNHGIVVVHWAKPSAPTLMGLVDKTKPGAFRRRTTRRVNLVQQPRMGLRTLGAMLHTVGGNLAGGNLAGGNLVGGNLAGGNLAGSNVASGVSFQRRGTRGKHPTGSGAGSQFDPTIFRSCPEHLEG
jgi:hypothetical protein